ncbi:PREDICTED: uncharacterized protein K02A2.6-like [Vollenhovia emeryi]|uniref:uncharacterized protein K02A2.6-like n=1 Tax=Vollenhovia emeryi TaxID=411798 RepID=UPI0005F3A5E1|nr:PREDICTED: uncharacterized protein K02A2.6-like [Vollenhovia emeryi]
MKKQIGDSEAAEFFTHRLDLQVVGDCLYHGDRPVIPPKLRRKLLEELHDGHPGASRMQALARIQCFWPGINQQINSFVQRCGRCAINAKTPRKETLHPWPQPSRSWERLHIDFAGPMDGDVFLVVVDAFSNWPEIVRMRCTTANKTVEVLEEIFARWGPCKTIVSDNGPQFVSSTFKEFCKRYAIEHITSAPYHPQSNGRAERFVDIMKTGMKKLEGEGNTDEKLRSFLANYRRTPSYAVEGKSPFELMTGRKMPTRLDHLQAGAMKKWEPSKRIANMAQQFARHHGAKHRTFEQNEPIYYQMYQNNVWTWRAGTIVRQLGAANYEIKIGDRVIKAHTNQLKRRFVNDTNDQSPDYPSSAISNPYVPQGPPVDETGLEDATRQSDDSAEDSFHSLTSQSEQEDEEEQLPTPPQPSEGRPRRATRPPTYLKDYILSVLAERQEHERGTTENSSDFIL